MANFASDNVTAAHPAIMAAIQQANQGSAMPYGADDWTKRVEARLSEIFETEVAALPVATGSAANVLGLSLLTPPYGAIYCHHEAHIEVDECGGPELYTGGAKLTLLSGDHGKFDPAALEQAIVRVGDVHAVQPAAVSLTQATEAGTIYSQAEIEAVAAVARRHGLGLQMDGARFANALVTLGCSPAEMTWKAGVDVLAFGGTKNGCFAAEAIVLFDPSRRAELGFRRKRGGHLFSKMRFLSAQLDAYLADDLWLANARHANALAGQLAQGLAALPGVTLHHPVEANMIFARLPRLMVEALKAAGFEFYAWDVGGAPGDGVSGSGEAQEVRLVAAFNSESAGVERFLATAGESAGRDLQASA